jgi:hypothetical protein
MGPDLGRPGPGRRPFSRRAPRRLVSAGRPGPLARPRGSRITCVASEPIY